MMKLSNMKTIEWIINATCVLNIYTQAKVPIDANEDKTNLWSVTQQKVILVRFIWGSWRVELIINHIIERHTDTVKKVNLTGGAT